MTSCIQKNRDAPILQNLSGNPRRFVSGIHSKGFYFGETAANRIIYSIPSNTVVDIAGSNFYCQYNPIPFASSVRFVGKLPFVLTLYTNIPQSGSVVDTAFSPLGGSLSSLFSISFLPSFARSSFTSLGRTSS